MLLRHFGRNQRTPAAQAALIAAAASLSACSDPMSSEAEDLATTEQEIVNGLVLTASQTSSNGLVAVYHKSWDAGLNGAWYPRPCSGKILRTVNGVSAVLTARHCVTRDGTTDGTVLNPNELRLVADNDPGLALPNPPAGTTPTSIIAHPVIAALPGWSEHQMLAAYDSALVFANVDWSSRVTEKPAFYLGGESPIGRSTYGYGYGVNEMDDADDCEDPYHTPGAGIARRGGTFPINGFIHTSGTRLISHLNWDSNGEFVGCGDSGGPSQRVNGSSPNGWLVQYGVNSRMEINDFYLSAPAAFLSFYIGFYVSAYSDRTRAIEFTSNGSADYATLSTTPTRLQYSPSSEHIEIGWGGPSVKCMYNNGTATPRWGACGTTNAYKWQLFPNGKVLNRQDGMCLNTAGTAPVRLTSTCLADDPDDAVAAPYRWAWHAQL